MKTKTAKCWSIKRGYGKGKPFINVYYTNTFRHGAIEALRHNLFYKYSWPQLKKMGYSVIKVEVKEVR